jgi:hypothetical protein
MTWVSRFDEDGRRKRAKRREIHGDVSLGGMKEESKEETNEKGEGC